MCQKTVEAVKKALFHKGLTAYSDFPLAEPPKINVNIIYRLSGVVSKY